MQKKEMAGSVNRMSDSSIKMLLVYDVSYPHVEGGGQRRMYEVARRLSARGYIIDWICFKTWNEDADVVKFDGIRYLGLPGFRGLYRQDGSRRRVEPLEFLFSLMRSKIRLKDYDVVWSGQWPMLHLLWWILWPRLLGKSRLFVDWWEIWGDTWFRYAKLVGIIGYSLEKILIRIISKKGGVILVSPGAYNCARLMSPNGNLSLINNGIDLDAIARIKQGEVRKFDISYLGRLKDHKRVDLLISAVAILKEQYKMVLSVVIIGDGPELPRLVGLAKALNIINQIIFVGAISSNEEVYGFLKGSRIFVNPSIKEGGGSITLFEAFASGLPVVAFNCKDGIDSELIGDFTSGRLCEPVSARSLASCIHSLMINPVLLSSLQKGALNEAKKYDWDTIAGEYLNLFQQKSQNSQ